MRGARVHPQAEVSKVAARYRIRNIAADLEAEVSLLIDQTFEFELKTSPSVGDKDYDSNLCLTLNANALIFQDSDSMKQCMQVVFSCMSGRASAGRQARRT